MIKLMVIVWLIVLGLCLGSFVNALVWRLHEQEALKDKNSKTKTRQLERLSITHGRSMCSTCGHRLAVKDLIPVLSWAWLRGKCRHCQQPIPDTPLPEVFLAVVLPLSYAVWPYAHDGWSGLNIVVFSTWVLLVTGLTALLVYDLKWFLLPNKILYPLTVIGLVFVVLLTISEGADILRGSLAATILIGGLFYGLYQISNGAWIGGGDVKLGPLLGILAGSFMSGLLLLFLASLLGVCYSLVLATVKNKVISRKTQIPFGPFLIIAGIVAALFGPDIIAWYTDRIVSL